MIFSRQLRPLLVLLLSALTAVGCKYDHSSQVPRQLPESLQPAAAKQVSHPRLADALAEIDALPLQVYADGEVVPLATALRTFADARVVLVGETHNLYDNHLIQLAVLRTMHQRQPKLALGVEWFQQDVQQHLDDYIAGRITEAEMLARSGYYDRWRYDYRHYRPIMTYAREHRIPVLALNAPTSIVRQVSRNGLDSLSAEARNRIPASFDRSDQDYVQRIRASYDRHPSGRQSFDSFLSVQLLWDETMASNAARFLQQQPDHSLLILAGNGHASYRSGIADRIERRHPVSSLLVTAANLPPSATDVESSADYVVVTPSLDLKPSGKLGVMIDSQADSVRVSAVPRDSAAYRGGMRKGDQIVSIQNQPISGFSDLKYALIDKQPGERINLQVRNAANQTRHLDIVLQ